MRPTLRYLVVFAGGVPAALAAVLVHPKLWTLWFAYLGMVVLLAGFDAIFGLARRRLAVDTTVPAQVFIGESGTIRTTFTARGSSRPMEVDVVAEMDDEIEVSSSAAGTAAGALATAHLTPAARGASTTLLLPVRARRRGSPRLHNLHLRWTGPLGLIERRAVVRVDRPIPVVPNVAAVKAIALRTFSNRELMVGMKVEKYIGDGSEFESLREYVPGLDHRAIDWKASARHLKLLCQEFRAERNHQVVLAIDSGQLMTEPLDGVPRLDHAINAGLLLSWFCLKTGDRVGLVGFDDQVRTWADPLGGVHNFPRLQRLTSEIAYRRVETNYTVAMSQLTSRLRRRSLVVLLTDFLDTITAELMVENVLRLAKKHLVLFVALRDPGIERRALAAPRSSLTLQQAVVADDFARERHVVIERLRRAGVHVVDESPERFSVHLLNRYLDIKRRELI